MQKTSRTCNCGYTVIDRILYAFGLSEVKNTQTSRLSGGEKKRLSVSLELLSDPAILFLDEPTTGLDSVASYQCVKYLKQLALNGKTVVCAIHQPSAIQFEIFDVVYILAQGKCMYHGEPTQIVKFFDDIQLPCNVFHNPADYVANCKRAGLWRKEAIDLANGEYGRNCVDLMNEVAENGKNLRYFPNDFRNERKTSNSLGSKTGVKSQLSHELYEFKTLLSREYLKLTKNLTLTYLRIIGSITNSIAIGSIFWNVAEDASKMWFSYNLVMCLITNLIMCALMLTVLSFPTEMPVLKKETFNGYYTLKNFYFSITLLDLPLSFLCNLISSLIIYYCTGLPLELHRFLMFAALGFMLALVSQSIGICIGALLDLHKGILVASYVHLPLFTISGFGLSFCDLPSHFNVFSYMSYVRYGLNGLVGVMYSYDRSKLSCPEDEYCLYSDGADFLEFMCIEGGSFWRDFGVLCVFYGGIRTATYLSMRWRLRA